MVKFRENRPRDGENLVDGKKIKKIKKFKKITRPKYNSLPLSLKRYAGDCNEEIKQLVEFGQCSNTALREKCNFRISPFYQVVQKHKLIDVAW